MKFGHFRCWHDSDEPIMAEHVRSLGRSGQADSVLEMTRLTLTRHSRCIRTLPSQLAECLCENCQPFAAAVISAGTFRRARFEEPGGALVHRELVPTGCITLFTTYSPMLSPISVPTRVEKR